MLFLGHTIRYHSEAILRLIRRLGGFRLGIRAVRTSDPTSGGPFGSYTKQSRAIRPVIIVSLARRLGFSFVTVSATAT